MSTTISAEINDSNGYNYLYWIFVSAASIPNIIALHVINAKPTINPENVPALS